jgi:hypothetical protein
MHPSKSVAAVGMAVGLTVLVFGAAAAQAERDNMALYDKMLAAVKAYPDITPVVTSLRDASAQNHLPAFARCAGTGN